ncbi:MAG: hypothetical protein II381_07645 [Victivallales bacterium]|nr:hypothetical protein [Victivallales bacterium]
MAALFQFKSMKWRRRQLKPYWRSRLASFRPSSGSGKQASPVIFVPKKRNGMLRSSTK